MAYNRCWIFGDEFGAKSFDHHFKSRCGDVHGYSKAHFDITGYFNNFTSENPSVIARFGNLLVNVINKKCDGKFLPLPKIIVITPDDDLIKCIDPEGQEHCVTKPITRVLNHIMTEFDRNVASYKDYLQAKSIRADPHFLWIAAPLHSNFLENRNLQRQKFNRCLEEVVKLHHQAYTLSLKKVWDLQDPNL